jgi:formylglycine-generating enzyme required for sulfatase activity
MSAPPAPCPPRRPPAAAARPAAWPPRARAPLALAAALGVVALGCKDEAKPAEDGVPEGMVRVELAPFEMGCTDRAGICALDEQPPHEVTLTRPFYLDVFEVSVGAFSAVLNYLPVAAAELDVDRPVVGLDWHEAAAYAVGRSRDEGVEACYVCEGLREDAVCEAVDDILTCGGYRLPTEAEWEGAARCGQDVAWAGGDELAAVAWTADSPPPDALPQPGGLLQANPCGVYDLSGNVAEWTHSAYGVYPTGSVTDPVDGDDPALTATRGGHWLAGAEFARLAARAPTRAVGAEPTLGVRLARTAPAGD